MTCTVAGVDPLVGAALRPLYGALKSRCAALSNGDGARSGAERMRSATNHSGWLTVTEGHRDPLLAMAGTRVSEACRLDHGDVDLRHGVLTVRDSKFGKSRDIPIHPSTNTILNDHSKPAGGSRLRDFARKPL
jgi:site-specific recombinase XerC